MVNAQRVSILRVGCLPSDRHRAPVAGVGTGADCVVEDNPVHVGAAVRESQGMARVLAHPVPLEVKGLHRLVRRTVAHHAPVVQVAESFRLVRLPALFDGTAGRIPEVVNVPVVVEPPSVHLAQAASALVRLGAALHRAVIRPVRSLEQTQRIAVLKEAATVLYAIAVGIVRLIAAVDATLSHYSRIQHLRVRSPGFYGSTYCVTCGMHKPVGKHGEFTWIEPDGSETGSRVGT